MSTAAYVDGSCKRNPGPAGSACIVLLGDNVWARAEFIGEKCTNNQAELRAIQFALEYFIANNITDGEIYSDSEYAVNSVAGRYKPRNHKNEQLIESLISLRKQLPTLKLFWVRGHSGLEWNENSDKLSKFASENPDYKHSALYSLDEFKQGITNLKD